MGWGVSLLPMLGGVGSAVSLLVRVVKSIVPKSLRSSDILWIWMGLVMRSSKILST